MVDIATKDYSVNIEKDVVKQDNVTTEISIANDAVQTETFSFDSKYSDIIVDVEIEPDNVDADVSDLVENHYVGEDNTVSVVLSNLAEDTSTDNVSVTVKALLLE
jgi:hypothetical protein